MMSRPDKEEVSTVRIKQARQPAVDITSYQNTAQDLPKPRDLLTCNNIVRKYFISILWL